MIPKLSDIKTDSNNPVDNNNPVINGIVTNNMEKNPNYNPKTKKGRAEPQFIKTEPKSPFDGYINKVFDSQRKMSYDSMDLGYTPEEIDDYMKSGLVANPYNTREELDKARASKQSWIAQLGDMVVQSVVNEVVLGGIKGFSDLFDAIANINTAKGEDDYTNPISSMIEGWQDYIRKEFAIHRENPNASWDIADFGWWADNGVSAASTLSMLLPTIGISKGISLAGKGLRAATKMGKISTGIAKIAKGAKAVDNAGKLTKETAKLAATLNNGSEIAFNAFISRTIEGYMEARGVYKEVYDEALANVKGMNAQDREKFFKINPELADKSDEDIAKYIASVSADETFQNDYAMLFMDMIQFKALKGIWKKQDAKRLAGTGQLNQRAAAITAAGEGSSKEVQRAIGNIKLKDKLIDFKNNLIANPGKTLTSGFIGLEWSEGVEEIYQGIYTEKGKEVAKKIFDPTYQSRDLADYLTDPAILEQGFWGVMGAAMFGAYGKGLHTAGYKIQDLINRSNILDKKLDIIKNNNINAQTQEIINRTANVMDFNRKMEALNNGYHHTEIVKNNNGEEEYRKLDAREVAEEKEKLIDEFIFNIVTEATNVGNYDLLREYITDPEMKKHLMDVGIVESNNDALFEKEVLKRMDYINENYSKQVESITNNVSGYDEDVVKILASSLTRKKLYGDRLNDRINELEIKLAEVNETENGNKDLTEWYNKQLNIILDYQLNDINKKVIALNLAKQNGEITDNVYNTQIGSLNILKRKILNYAKNNLANFGSLEGISELTSEKSDLQLFEAKFRSFVQQYDVNSEESQQPTPHIMELLLDKAALDFTKYYNDTLIPSSNKEIQDAYRATEAGLQSYTEARFNGALIDIKQYINKSENLNEAKQALLSMEGIDEEYAESLKIVRLGQATDKDYNILINNEIEKVRRAREKEAEEAKKVTEDGQELSEEQAENKQKELAKASGEENEDSSSSTGKIEQSSTSELNIGDKVDLTDYHKTFGITNKSNTGTVVEFLPNGNARVKLTDGTLTSINKDKVDTIKKLENTEQKQNNFSKGDKVIYTDPQGQKYEGAVNSVDVTNNTASITFTNGNTFKNITLDSVERVANNRAKEEAAKLAESQKPQEIDQDIRELEDAKLLAENEINDNDSTADFIANRIILDMIRNNTNNIKDILLSFDEYSKNTKQYNDFINLIAKKLYEEEGVSLGISKISAEKGLIQILNMLYSAKKENKFKLLANKIAMEISTGQSININSSGISFNNTSNVDEEIDTFLKEYAKDRGYTLSEKGRTLIDTLDLFNYIINNKDITIEEAKFIIRNLRQYIKDNAGKIKGFAFTNKKLINDVKKSVQDIFNAIEEARKQDVIIADKLHANLPTVSKKNTEKYDAAQKALRKYNANTDVITFKTDKKSDYIAIMINGVEIGFLGKVQTGNTNNTLQLATFGQKNGMVGLRYQLTKNGDNYTSNLDDLFHAIFEKSTIDGIDGARLRKICDKIYTAQNAVDTTLNENELTNNLFESFLNEDDIKFVLSVVSKVNAKVDGSINLLIDDEDKQAARLIEDLNKVIHRHKFAVSTKEKISSFNLWKQSQYNNYAQTLDIQTKLEKGKNITTTIDRIDYGSLNYDDSKPNNLSDLDFQADVNPIVYVSDDTTLIDENGKTYSNIKTNFRVGSLGILVKDYNGNPLVAGITDSNLVNSSEFADATRAELRRLIEGFFDKTIDFDTLTEYLGNLMGGLVDKKGLYGNHLFKGFIIVKTNDKIAIQNQYTNEYIGIFHRYKPGGKEIGTGFTHRSAKYKDGKKSFIKKDDTMINELINTIMDGLKFNTLYFMNNHRNENTVTDVNKYFGKEDGKFYIKIGSTKKVYNNYTHFALSSKAFITNQQITRNEDGNNAAYYTSDVASAFYLNSTITENTTVPVEEQTTNKSFKSVVESANKEKAVNTTNVLEAAGVRKKVIKDLNIIFEGEELSLVPDKVYYDNKSETEAFYDGNSDKVFLGRSVLKGQGVVANKILKLLMHERLHQVLIKHSNIRQENIVNALIDTFKTALKHAQDYKDGKIKITNKAHRNAANELLRLNNENFNPENIFKTLEEGKVPTNRTQESYFAEEWIVEALTNSDLIDYLNSIEYGNATIDETKPKTLWQTIIEKLLKLFGLSNKKINNFTILAEQIKILSGEINNTNNETNTENNNEQIQDDTESNIEPIVNTENNKELTEEDILRQYNGENEIEEFDDSGLDDVDYNSSSIEFHNLGDNVDQFSENPTMNPNGYVIITNMNDYINTFPEKDRVKIRKMVDEGYISFVCKA